MRYKLRFDRSGADRTLRDTAAGKHIGPALEHGARLFVEIVQVYPPEHHESRKAVYGVTFFTLKQQRFFFWALKNGIIEVPYRRGLSPGTQDMKNKWQVRVAGQFTYIAENAATYSSLVMGRKQTLYHKRGDWKTTDFHWKQRGGDVQTAVRDKMLEEYRRSP